MFFRTLRRQSTRRVLVHGLPYFGTMFANLMNGDGWQFWYYPDAGISNLAAMARDLRACDLAYQIGGRVTAGKFLHVAHLLKKNKIVMHWVGSDTVDERNHVAEGKAEPWIRQDVHHWAESDWMSREVESLGLPCELVPLPSSRVPDRPSPLPGEFSVLIYMPAVNRGALYGLDRMLQVARGLPHIPFELVGLLEGAIPDPPPNLLIYGRIPNLAAFYERASVVWRPVRHDGLSFMVLEALGYGRHVLWSYPFPGCLQVACACEAQYEIARLHALHQQRRLEINRAGVQAVAKGGYLPQYLKGKILARLEQILES